MFTCIYRNLNKLCMSCQTRNSRRKRSKRPKNMVRMGNKNRKQGTYDQENSRPNPEVKTRTIRLATFNTALFSMAPALPRTIAEQSTLKDASGERYQYSDKLDAKGKTVIGSSSTKEPRSILKQFPGSKVTADDSVLYPMKKLKYGEVSGSKSRLRVTINLPENEISLSRLRHSRSVVSQDPSSSHHGMIRRSNSVEDLKTHLSSVTSLVDFPYPARHSISSSREIYEVSSPRPYETSNRNRNILEVLKEVDADLVALQEVKAEEEKGMKPLSELAEALGMKYVFAESWAPQYGNAILSKWPIKRWNVQKIVDDSDFRNVLKVVVDVPLVGELHIHCTQLDHLDEGWRMKQVTAMVSGEDTPHILIGGLNSLDTNDYSEERWEDIVKFNEEKGKPTPKGEVMKLLKAKGYIDARHFAGDCESVVVIARGQEVQGTCKYGTRVDYILASHNAPYKFVPGSYAVVSSRGTSDHHVVKVDIQLQEPIKPAQKQRAPRIWQPSPSRGIWRLH
ncbi:uncharacterized protein LOC131077163 isoform X2 [Cryptomeria japonica]|uniref:uncharacterized protein LOC131077163 isoform X2 n=1 Tax=Cryptomeria japonica TaxID=3369 RepID=UPI0025AD43AE|nr:uncharacterized protein LOC131077163 isoform X2 [Cryptomeria japonica]